jgi:hypothetical protein
MSENFVSLYTSIQGVYNPNRMHIQIPRHINSRLVSIENSSDKSVAFYISADESKSNTMVLAPSNVLHLALNPHGGCPQYIHIIDESKAAHKKYQLSTASNQVVLRDGMHGWFPHFFQRPSYKASH